jgi:hypothetical protein
MDRPSFGTRARKRIWREALASAKGRVTPFVIGIVGIFLGFLLNTYYLHLQTAKQLALMTILSLGGSYAIWLLGALIVNTLRVPWLLDAESSELIDTQENRARTAENNLAEIGAARQKHDLFARLMQQGVDFSCQIAECQTDAHFASWDRHSNEWIKSVQQAIREMGFPADAVEFVRAGEYAEPVKGVVNTGSKQEERARVLEKHQENLADFVRRRLP